MGRPCGQDGWPNRPFERREQTVTRPARWDIILKKELNNLMIGRIWHGWTKPEYADKYEQLLKQEIIPGIAARKLAGYRAFQLLRRPLENEIEFITIMWFDSWEAVKQFAGEDYEEAHVPPVAREVLERFDGRSQHYEIKELLEY
jgi:hypothetical protein